MLDQALALDYTASRHSQGSVALPFSLLPPSIFFCSVAPQLIPMRLLFPLALIVPASHRLCTPARSLFLGPRCCQIVRRSHGRKAMLHSISSCFTFRALKFNSSNLFYRLIGNWIFMPGVEIVCCIYLILMFLSTIDLQQIYIFLRKISHVFKFEDSL